jgi:prophage regulatory protein
MHEHLAAPAASHVESSAVPLPPNDRFLRIDDLVHLTGMGKTWITDRVRRGEFPSPIKMGHSAVWQESAVRGWMAQQIAKSQSKNVA